MKLLEVTTTAALLVTAVCAEPVLRVVKSPKTDLGYAIYEGSYDAKNSINVFKG